MFWPMRMPVALQTAALLFCVSGGLVACGGGGGGTTSTPPPPVVVVPPPIEPVVVTVGPGEFKSATVLKTFAVADIAKAVADSAGALPAVVPKYAVKSYKLEYLTLDGDGRQVLASALINVPEKPTTPSATGAFGSVIAPTGPLLALQHGTTSRDAEAPTNYVRASEVSVVLASMGYQVLAPDYVGYGSSKGKEHPYLLSAPSASVVLDMLTAAKYWRQSTQQLDNGQLFLAGYSEGGYTSVAASRALAAGTSPHAKSLALVVAGGGPYQVYVTLDEILKHIREKNALLGALVNPGFLRLMGDSVRASVRNALLDELLGSGADVAFHPAMIDSYLADNVAGMEQQSNVHDWKPVVPIRFFHGQDDQTVSYKSSTATLLAMQNRGAASQVSLTNCKRQPATHLDCVPPFWQFVVTELGAVARDL
ncbi:MAG: hypothetical protein CFE43_18500 [Burkholderiales bacterium PBB3]|nr:MAG: hypothetical protein CFE43_18500 [Burkholderiales bacterium PBB3]